MPNARFNGRIVYVTGAASGLGRATATQFAQGGINTPLIRSFVPQPDYVKRLVGYYLPPAPHMMGTPENVARTIAFLASDDARMVNGAALVADFGTLA